MDGLEYRTSLGVWIAEYIMDWEPHQYQVWKDTNNKLIFVSIPSLEFVYKYLIPKMVDLGFSHYMAVVHDGDRCFVESAFCPKDVPEDEVQYTQRDDGDLALAVCEAAKKAM